MLFTKTVAVLIFLGFSSESSGVPFEHGRVFNGDTAEPGQFPFIVSIQVDIGGGHLQQQCGASILNSRWLLTAAHCFYGYGEEFSFHVIANTTTLDSGGIVIDIDSKILHPDYNTTNYINDIALVKLNQTLTFDATTQNIEIDDVEANETCTLIGWGITADGGGNNILRYGELSALSEEDCARLAEGGKWIFDRIDGQICGLSENGVAPCLGDGGGPLVCHQRLVGLSSYSITPCGQGYPDVYTRTSYYVDWIEDVIANN